jgi:hypothetical protein
MAADSAAVLPVASCLSREAMLCHALLFLHDTVHFSFLVLACCTLSGAAGMQEGQEAAPSKHALVYFTCLGQLPFLHWLQEYLRFCSAFPHD